MRKYRAEQCCPCPVLFPPRFLANAVLASLNARASGVRSHDHAQAPKYPAVLLKGTTVWKWMLLVVGFVAGCLAASAYLVAPVWLIGGVV